MSETETVGAGFIAGGKGQLFTLHRAPKSISASSECFVLAPSFAEEMNRCRYMCTMLAQELTRQGHGYLSVDPFGTGDSEGNFVEADWEGWCDDLVMACEHAGKLGYKRISLLGVRVGALLAMDIASKVRNLHRIVLWQPVISGKTALTQFLRIRIAASLERDEKAGTVAEFEKDIDAGQAVQVAGYDVSPALYLAMKSAHLEQHLDFKAAPIAWFNTLASEDRKTPRVEANFLDSWREKDANIDHITVIGPSYWAVHERTLAPSLVEATVQYVAGEH